MATDRLYCKDCLHIMFSGVDKDGKTEVKQCTLCNSENVEVTHDYAEVFLLKFVAVLGFCIHIDDCHICPVCCDSDKVSYNILADSGGNNNDFECVGRNGYTNTEDHPYKCNNCGYEWVIVHKVITIPIATKVKTVDGHWKEINHKRLNKLEKQLPDLPEREEER